MKKTILAALVILSFSAKSQTKAMTEDGKEVVLFDNKTWKFVNESDDKVIETISTNEQLYEKAKEATFIVRSKNVEAGFYYNPKKWKITQTPISTPFLEYAFMNTSNSSLYGLFASEIMPIQSLKNLKDIVISMIQRRVDYFRLKKSEYRTINGIKILHIEYSANVKGLDFEYISNFYLTAEGYSNISTYTYANQFEANKEQMEDFVNGIVKADKAAEVTSVVEVAPPPPSMPSKKTK